MKGKLNKEVPVSDSKILSIGTEFEIVNGWCGCEGYFYQCIVPDGTQMPINSDYIDITDHSPYIDWEQRRYEIAKEVTAKLYALTYTGDIVASDEDLAKSAIKQADGLIKQLKGENHAEDTV